MREWTAGNLLRLVQNPVYQGHLVQRKTNKKLSEKDYIRFENAHEAYVSQGDLEAIMALIKGRRNLRKCDTPRTPNRYHGLVYTKGKTTQIPRRCRHFSNNRSDYDYYYFMDYIYDRDRSERQTVYISEQALDNIILELIQTELNRLGTLQQLLPRLEAKKEDCLKGYQRQIKYYRESQSRLQAEQGDLYMTYSLNRQNRKTYLVKKQELTSKIDTLSQKILNCEQAMRQVEEMHQKQIVWANHLAKCQKKEVLTSELLAALIERIEVDVNKIVTVTFACQLGG